MFTHGDPERWEAEPEVVVLLASIVKSIQPNYVVETGCYHGTTTKALAEALDFGHLDTMDTDISSVTAATGLCCDLPVRVHHCSSLEFVPEQPIGFAFLDSDPDIRLDELAYFTPHMGKNGLVAIHDSSDISVEGWSSIGLPTRLGLTLLQRLQG